MALEKIEEVVCSVKRNIAELNGFELTDAVCPICEFELCPGFRLGNCQDKIFGTVHYLAITQSKPGLFELFTDIIQKIMRTEKAMQARLDAVFESRHDPDDESQGAKYDCTTGRCYRDFIAKRIDPVAFLSLLYDYEQLFTNDGFTGVSAVYPKGFTEVRLDVHKTLCLFSPRQNLVNHFAHWLATNGLPKLSSNVAIMEDMPHVHIGHSDFATQFNNLLSYTGAELVA